MGKITLNKVGCKLLLLGNEALARGAIEAGVQLVASYPGTPSSEITENLIEASKELGFYAEWSVNEKVAFDMAAGASLIGARTMVPMKNAGLNVAMDLFMTLPYGGIRGGLVLVVADDPAPLYSSAAQDCRFAAQWAGVPCLEPENQQEAKDMVKEAFLLSERLELPVMVRSVARLSHSCGLVELGTIEASNMVQGFNKHWKLSFRWGIYGPPGGGSEQVMQLLREQFPNAEYPSFGNSGWKQAWLLSRQPLIHQESEASTFCELDEGDDTIGVVATGLGATYSREAIRDLGLQTRIWFYKPGFAYPLAEKASLSLLRGCKRLLVIEDGSHFIESQLRLLSQKMGLRVEIKGKMNDAVIAPYGEIDIDMVRRVLAKFAGISQKHNEKRQQLKRKLSTLVTPRSSTLCAGCPHLGAYWALRQVMKLGRKHIPIVNVDIGCYEQAGYGMQPYPEPTNAPSEYYRSNVLYNFLDTCYVMGSAPGMALGQERVGYRDGQIVVVEGDSSFYHTCMPALVDAIWNGTKLTLLVLDNHWTAMTGHQPCPVSGSKALGEVAHTVLIEEVAKAMGAGVVEVVNVYHLEETEKAIRKGLAFDGVSVIVLKGECKLQEIRREGKKPTSSVVVEACKGCLLCINLGCPAITFTNRIAGIDPLLCVGCDLCAQLCPTGAITTVSV